jgi:general L-amino acid transport system permease protein
MATDHTLPPSSSSGQKMQTVLKYIRSGEAPKLPPPSSVSGPVAWIRKNMLSGPLNIALTLISIYIIYLIVPSMIKFFIIDAVWTGSDRDVCLPEKVGRPVGACWAYVFDRVNYFIYGSYPVEHRWRVNLSFALFAFGVVWMLWLQPKKPIPANATEEQKQDITRENNAIRFLIPYRGFGALYFFVLMPITVYYLLTGASSVGLEPVTTSLWGGIMVTLVVASVGIVFSLPFGVLLALGRRSKMRAVRIFSIAFIEFVRGVPLITVLFMANTMLPFFLPEGVTIDRLLRALVGVAMFASAYMAEIVRGGLQAMPKGQFEGAMSLGLGYWQMMRLIILPQALKIVIPGVVNTFVALFKDTTLVFIVGLFDLLKTVEATLVDPTWATPTTRNSGYAFAAIFYFICCWGMSRYSLAIEKRLATGHKR